MQACHPNTRPSAKVSVRGVTLIETLIVMSILLVILGATHTFLSSGVDFYTRTVQGLEVQQQTLIGLTRMMDELEHSSFDKILVPAAPANDAVVFPSQIGADGLTGTNDKGTVLWRSIVCYMLRTQADGTIVLERKFDPHVDVDYPIDPLTIAGGARDVAYFTPRPATGIVVRNVAPPGPAPEPPSFWITKGTDKLTLSLKVEFSTSAKNATSDSMRVEGQVFTRY